MGRNGFPVGWWICRRARAIAGTTIRRANNHQHILYAVDGTERDHKWFFQRNKQFVQFDRGNNTAVVHVANLLKVKREMKHLKGTCKKVAWRGNWLISE